MAKKTMKDVLTFVRGTLQHFSHVDGSVKAAALAYGTLISLVPLMVLSVGFVLAFPSLSTYFQALHGYLFSHFIPSSANVIQRYVEDFAGNAQNLSATGLIFFVVTSVLLIFSMESVFNSIWNVETRRKGVRAFLVYWAVLTLMPPIGVIVVGATVFLTALPYVSSLLEIIGRVIPLILTIGAYLMLYMSVPNCPVAFRPAVIGASLAAVLFEITKAGFSFYVTNFSTDAVVYGVLSVIPVFLMWLYASWLITIYGACIAYKLSPKPRNAPTTSTKE